MSIYLENKILILEEVIASQAEEIAALNRLVKAQRAVIQLELDRHVGNERRIRLEKAVLKAAAENNGSSGYEDIDECIKEALAAEAI